MTPKEEQKHTDLLPCPFCGSAAIMNYGCGHYSDRVQCSKCTATNWNADPAAWNTRKADCHEELLAEARDTLIECRSYLTRPIEHHEARVHGLQSAINTAVQNINQQLARATNHQESGEKK